MQHWAPKPLRPESTDNLFPMNDTFEITKGNMSAIQRQRLIDGTPHTITGPTALRPSGPELWLGGEPVEKACSEHKDVQDPDAIVKAYLSHNAE